MKRFATIVGVFACTALLALFALGCGKSQETTVGELLDQGYESKITTYDESQWRSLMTKDGTWLDVTAKMTAGSYDAITGLDFFDDNYETQLRELVSALPVSSSKDITSTLPSQSDLDKFVGKTIGELEDAGYELSGYWTYGNEGGIYVTNSKFMLNASFDNSAEIEDVYALSDEARRALVITAMAFDEIEMTYFDQL